ncbi:hypothetical protein GCM10010967_43290 [Dyadobacter beijingensis]|uniref:Uncharacterized protein n=1 Tax=Dyadobacter beijingensis TaxID=365489 RepID=A0ABQ2IA23_9BACT|nr:hypothetical protein GCM10010967_43290 [Dyadobacter beijingensis]
MSSNWLAVINSDIVISDKKMLFGLFLNTSARLDRDIKKDSTVQRIPIESTMLNTCK